VTLEIIRRTVNDCHHGEVIEMPFYIRKSVSVGPFRFNLSSNGVGLSAGVKGFRVGTGPRGNYIHMGRGGLYYRTSFGLPRTRQSSDSPRPRSAQLEPPAVAHESNTLADVEVGDVLQMTPTDAGEIVSQINAKLKLWPRWPAVLAIGAAVLGYLANLGQDPAYLCVAAIPLVAATLGTVYADAIRKVVVLMYELDTNVERAVKAFAEAFDSVGNARRIWNIDTHGNTSEWKRNAGAKVLLTRSDARFSNGALSVIKTNINVPCILGGKQNIYFLPDFALVTQGSEAGAVSYKDLRIDWSVITFIEEGSVPSDSVVTGYSWKYANKNGGPDKRFKENRQIPNVRYQEMTLSSPSGLRKILQLSCVSDRSAFDKALSVLRDSQGDDANTDVVTMPSGVASGQITWTILPPSAARPNKVSLTANCSCGEPVLYDDEWGDDAVIECKSCDAKLGTFGNFKAQAHFYVADFMAKIRS
jgi:hypothetical protein